MRVCGSVTLLRDGGVSFTSSSVRERERETERERESYVLHRHRKRYEREISHLVVQQMCCRGITE